MRIKCHDLLCVLPYSEVWFFCFYVDTLYNSLLYSGARDGEGLISVFVIKYPRSK